MKTIVCAAFPGTGKTTLYEKSIGSSLTVLDSDSSKFDKNDFPQNYIKHIKDHIGKVDIILVSSHKEVRDSLVKNGIKFNLVYPLKSEKEEYIERYASRGSDDQFIKLLQKNWDLWIDECQEQTGCFHMKIGHNTFLEDAMVLMK